MIGLWDNTDCVMALPFTAWSRGNGRVNQNVGEMPAYPAGTYNATFTNMAAGYGYVFGGAGNGAGLCNFDGVDDGIFSSLKPAFTNASKHTFEIKFKYVNIGTDTRSLVFDWDTGDANNFWQLFVNGTAKKPILYFKIGGTIKNAISGEAITNGNEYHLVAVKDGATLKLYINGSEPGSYDQQDAYNLGNKTFSEGITFGLQGSAGTLQNAGEVYWLAVYNDALSQARITANATLGNDMGMLGLNTTDTMKLVTGVPVRRQVPGQISGQLAGQF